jgi:hypothetical protein
MRDADVPSTRSLMDEPHVSGERSGTDADAPLGRDDSDWFRRQLGEAWEPEEPGIYRFVGHPSSSSNGWGSGVEDDTSDVPGTQGSDRRWPPWRRS